MTKEEFINEIKKEIRNGESLLQRFENLKLVSYRGRWRPNDIDRQKLTNDLRLWEEYVLDVLKDYFGETQPKIVKSFSISKPNEWIDFQSFGISSINDNLTTLKSILNRLPLIDMNKASKDVGDDRGIDCSNSSKPYKVFISHNEKDKAFAKALVDMMLSLGIGEKDIFCASYPGFGIMLGKNIYEEILRQYQDYQLIVLFIHSPRFYESHVSLNEMGAAWVLKSIHYSFLTHDCEFSILDGVINNSEIAFRAGQENTYHCLNDFKTGIERLFGLNPKDFTMWENIKNDFLNVVNKLPITSNINNIHSTENDEDQTVFESHYLSFCSEIFKFLDVKNYSKWMYCWVCDGESRIYVGQYDNLGELVEFLNKFDYRKGFKELNSLLKNMKLLLKEYLFVCGQHILNFDKNEYRIEKFYKNFYPEQSDPYDYKEYVFLIHDLSFELTRLLNLILEKIRQYEPTFLGGYTLLTIYGEDQENVLYREEEKSDAPYPGLKQFVEETRFNRSEHLGTMNDINKLPISLPQCYTQT